LKSKLGGILDRRNLLIVPTRNRPESALELLSEFNKTAVMSDIVFGLDDDDTSEYSAEVLEHAERNPRLRMGGTLNLLAVKYAEEYDYLSFMGDDHRPRTQSWDLRLANMIDEGPGVAYGNDLLQGQNLPTAVMLSSEIVLAIGYMVPPVLVHMYMDNFWKEIGMGLGQLAYRHDVVIEHMHYLAGKAKIDEGYKEVNHSDVYQKDAESFHKYMSEQFTKDLKKIKG
jgi:hypothetical protein